MGKADQFFAVVEAVHRASLDPGLWRQALGAFGAFTGARAVALDTIGVHDFRHRAFRGWNMRATTELEYLGLAAGSNARVRFGVKNPHRSVFHDGDLFRSESELDREPFYARFLAHHDVRYFATGSVGRDREKHTFLTMVRTPRQGPTDAEHLRSLERLLPHVRLAITIGERMDDVESRARAALGALDWLTDGAAILAGDGRLIHANAAFVRLACAENGVCIRNSELEFAGSSARRAFEVALRSALSLSAGDDFDPAPAGFTVRRPSGLPPLVGSIRPVFRTEQESLGAARAVMFLHDPCRDRGQEQASLAAVFGLTKAEANLAAALRDGVSPSDYARERKVSINTVYTHLRRLKEKTGARRLPGVVQRLKDVAPSVRG